MQKLMQPQRLEAMREGFAGLEDSLSSGAERVEKLGGYYYPLVTIRGLRPEVEQRKFWPEGETVAEGLRKAAAGAKAAREEVNAIEEALPPLRASMDESRKMIQRTREALGLALARQGELEKLLKDAPEHTARLAEELPKLGQDLARVLRETAKLKQIAAALRQAAKGVDDLTAKWPELRDGLKQSAVLLRTTQAQLDRALEHRDELESALRDTVVLADTFATVLPGFLASLDGHLRDQEQGLEALGGSIDEAADLLPAYAGSAARLANTARWLAALVALLVAGHGIHVLLSVPVRSRAPTRPG
jgi:DNA repair exonuclease SbcCD ATPase subunit